MDADIYNLKKRISSGGKVITVAEFAAELHAAGHCSSVDNCVKRIRDYMTSQRSTGLGDTISKITHKLHIHECGGCQARKELLNKLVPYNG